MEAFITHQNEIIDIFSLITRDIELRPFMVKYQKLLLSLKKNIMTEKRPIVQQYHFSLLTLLYKLIPYTRDIYGGLGERHLCYAMLFLWNYHFPVPTAQCIYKMVLPIDNNPSYGSWRDIKNLCLFVKEHSERGDQDPLIETCIGMLNHQLETDYKKWNDTYDEYIRNKATVHDIPFPTPSNAGISLVCKWIPREHSSFDWLFKRCAVQWIRTFKPQYFKTCKDNRQFEAAMRKGSKEYRHIFTMLSKAWDTIEIKQCTQQWESIQFSNIPFMALQRQQQSLLNIGLSGNVRTKTMHAKDRQLCAKKLQLQWCTNNAYKKHHLDQVNPLFTDMGLFIKNALRASHAEEIKRVENNWVHILSQISDLPNTLPIVDMSLFFHKPDRFYDALGMACLVAMKSSKRIFLFDQTCHFISIENCNTVKEILQLISPIFHEHHIGQNYKGICDTLVKSIVDSKMNSNDISSLKLVFFTFYDEIDTIFDTLQKSLERAAITQPPILLIWRANQTVPSVTPSYKEHKAFILSGNANYMWTRISHLSDDVWKKGNSLDLIAHFVNQPRYKPFEEYFSTILQLPPGGT
jgi:hypothetical protein